MTYKEIIELVKGICNTHHFVNQFGYGNISDINVPSDEEAPDYPYAFVNPTTIVYDGRTAVISFNLIMMTQCYDTEADYIFQQSNCIEYLMDIISKINMSLDEPLVEFITPFSVVPFKERFSDNVVGATATISIRYPALLDNCNSPY